MKKAMSYDHVSELGGVGAAGRALEGTLECILNSVTELLCDLEQVTWSLGALARIFAK